jgi:rRNA-processing protein FCF1
MECINIFESLEVEESSYSDITSVCASQIRELMRRDDFNLAVSVEINNQLLELCEQTQEIQEILDECCGYYDYDLGDFII